MKTYPLSQSQMGIFMEMMQHPQMTQYNLVYTIDLLKDINLDRLEHALKTIYATRPEWRIRFLMEGEEPRQTVDDIRELQVTRLNMPETQVEACLKEINKPFDPFNDILCCFHLIETPKRIVFRCAFSHLISDGTSMAYHLTRDVKLAFAGEPLPEYPYGMLSWAEEEEATFHTTAYENDKEYYRQHFQGCEALSLAENVSDPMGRYIRYDEYLPKQEVANWCNAHGTSPNLLLMAAFAYTLSVAGRENNFAFTTFSHGRSTRNMKQATGMFVRTVPVRASVNPEGKVIDFIQSFRAELMATIRHGGYPFRHFCHDLQMKPGISFNYLSDVKTEDFLLDGTLYPICHLHPDTTCADLALDVYEHDGSHELRVIASDKLYTLGFLQAIAKTIKTVAMDMMRQPDATLSSLHLVTEEEQTALIRLGQGDVVTLNPSDTMVSMFRKQASRTPDNTAVVFKDRRLTYRELDELTDKLAAYLITRFHVQAEETVGVMIERSELMVIYPIAIMKAGAAYMPLDFQFPEERLRNMCQDAGVRLILSEEDRVRQAMPSFQGEVFVSKTLEELPLCDCQMPEPDQMQRFVILFTSGSTGRPKGVVLEHHNIVNLCLWYMKEAAITHEDRLLGFSNFGFDTHMSDIYPALFTGASVYILPSDIRMDLEAVNRYMVRNGITIAFLTTQLGHMFASTMINPSLRLLMVAGEKLLPLKAASYTVMNAYGPTESHISTFYNITEDYDSALIGRPIDNHQLYIVDGNMRMVPRGFAGELIIGGEGVARGYLHPTEKDAGKFMTYNGKRAYRTGDLVRWSASEDIEFIGRIDTQVKLRGFRIELGEIESQALKFESISQAVAAVYDGQLLCLYYTADGETDENVLREFLAKSLPEYMVPAAYIHLEELPLTPNGKIDRKRLPAPQFTEEETVSPATPLEQRLFDIASERIGTRHFGVTTNLISIGLSSIATMRLSIAIRQETGYSLSVRDILSAPTVRQMAKTIEEGSGTGLVNLADYHVVQEYYPMTETQRGVYIDWEMNRGTTQYNIPHVFRFKDMDAERLADALRKVVDAHCYIKTRLAVHGGEVMQQRRDGESAQVSLTYLDQEPDTAFFQGKVHPFNPFEETLYRLEVYAYGNDTWLFKDFHHLVSDGLSEEVFYNDLMTVLHGGSIEVEELTAFDVALYEQEQKKGEDYLEAQAYFDSLLEGTEAVGYPHSVCLDDTDRKSDALTIEMADGAKVRKACSIMGITENGFFQTVLTQVLHRITREKGIMLATVSAGRHLTGMDRMIGMLVKTIPLVSICGSKDDMTFADAAKAVHRQGIESVARDFYPLIEVVERHGMRPQILFAFQGGMYDGINLGEEATGAVDIPLKLDTQKFPIELTVWPNGKGGYTVSVSYDTARYCRQDMEAFAKAFVNFANHASKDGIRLADIELTTKEEQTALIELGQGKHLDIDPQMTFVKAFEQCASLNPDRLAVADATDSLTYSELSRRSDILAHQLVASGVKPNDFVAVMLDRTIAFPLAVIAIHKVGAAYVPIDLEYPEERQQYMLDDSEAKVVIDSRFIAETDFSHDVAPIDLSTADGLAYMIYTSGSTGKPKGVMLRQSGLYTYINAIVHTLDITSSDRISLHRAFSFDSHIHDLYPPLLVGGSVHIMPASIRRDLADIRDFIISHRITGGGYTTSLGALLVKGEQLPLRYITLSGEKMTDLISGDVQLVNGYGPTECTDLIAIYKLERGRVYDNIPIGRPMANGYCFITDSLGRLLPRGVVGELCFASAQVGAGYWHQPELTAEKFCDCPFLRPSGSKRSEIERLPSGDGQPARMYRTGDLCRWNDEGLLEFICRIDNQVKLRGYRVEPGEIESCANGFKGISQAVAVVRQIGGSDTLCLYYTTDQETAVDTDELRSFLGQTLAEYMVPTAYMQLDALPLLPNGKVDRRPLPEPTFTSQKEYIAPENKAEEVIARLLGDVLSWNAPISMLDNFFSLGGDSIKLIHLVSLLYNEGYTSQVSELMKCSTVRDMASKLTSSDEGPAIAQEPVTGAITPGAFQRRFLSWKLAQPGRFIQSMVLRSSQAINLVHLQQTLQALTMHHDMLRATVVGSSIVIRPTTDEHPFSLNENILPGEGEVGQTIAEAALREGELIDLEHGPILRAVLLHAADGDRLLLVCHHIAIDGVSWRILADDLQTAMNQLNQGKTIVLPKKTHSFAYWTDTVSRYRDSYLLQAEKPYWQQVQGQMESMELTTAGSTQARHLTVTLEGEPLRQLLTESSKAYNTEINDLLLTALSQSYYRLTGNGSLTIQMEGHGREPLHEPVVTDRTVGWFTSLYPVVIQGITGDVRHDVRLVKEVLRDVPNKGIGYGILQYMESHEGDAMLRTDLTPLVGFNYLGEVTNSDAEIVFTEPLGVPLPSVDVNCAIADGRFVARFEYDVARWTDDKAQQLADAFVEELSRVAVHTAQSTAPEPTASDFGATGWTDEQLQNVIGHLAISGEQLQRVYPLSPMQEGILITYLSDRDTTAYRLLSRLSLSVLPTESALRHTLDYLAAKHEVLRTAIFIEGVPQPCQAIVSRQLGLEMRDLTGEPDIEAAATAVHQEMLHRNLSLTDDPLFQLVCMKTGDDSCQLLIFMHHIISDGWCTPIIFRDLLMKLDAETAGRPLTATPEQNGRYEAFVRQLLHRDRKAGLAYWKNLLSDYDSRAALPSYGQPAERDLKPIVRHTLDVSLTASLRELAIKSGVTLNTVMELGWGLILQTYCRTDDAVFLRVVSGRDSDGDNSQLVGLFINSVPVRVHTTSSATVRQTLKELQEQSAQSAAYDFCPLSEILSQSSLGSSLFQSVMAFENYPLGDTLSTLASHKWNIRPVQMEEEPFGELSIAISPEVDGALRLTFTYDTSLYSEQQMEQVADTFENIVRNMVSMPDGLLTELPLVTAEAQVLLTELGSGKHQDIDPQMTFVKAFEQCASLYPDRLAVADAHDSLTYRELSRRSDVLAHRLIASGVKPNDFVAVMLDRTIAFPLAVIAIHKVGAAYVPIDLEYPEERQQYMLRDCQAKVVVDSQFMADTDFNQAVSPIDLSIADGLAYMIYTSGSTGKPKGAVLHQAGLWNFISVIIDMEHLTTNDRISGHRSFSFDAHVEDLFPILTIGGSFHLMPEGIRKNLAAIRDFLFEHQITGGGYATPIVILLLNTYDDLPVRFMTAGGEKLAGVFSDHIEIINVYGPTECTCDTSYYIIKPGSRISNIPIGQTVANCYHFIIDKQGRLVPRGAEGELCFAGIQVGCGYWCQPELTAEKFCYCPFLPTDDDGKPVRMYRTGDLCRWNAEGQLEYFGRQDTQVKLRGYRIELGEIESCASKFEGISQAVAVIRPIGNTDTLCLYYTVDGNTMVDAGELRQFMTLTLAEYMVPTAYMQMDALPLTPNGKVDRRRLPEPTLQHAGFVAPRNELEKLIVSGFEKVLNQEKIGINDDFVLLGGDSLQALKLVISLQGYGITVADVLSLRTPAAIASNAKGVSVNLNRYSIESGCPLNNTQMFIYQDIVKFNKYDSYLIPSLIPIDRKYTDEQIRDALDTVFTAHPVLTMHVAMRDGVPYMEKGEKPAVMKGSLNPLKILSLLTSGFDLYSSLSRHVIVRILGRCYLLSVFHHLIFDKVSNNVFYRHFQRALEGKAPLAEATSLDSRGQFRVDDHFLEISSFHQEVKSTAQYAEMDKYIRSMLGNLSEANFYRNPDKPGKPGYHMRELGIDREQVNRFTERFGITKNILFTAAMAMTLSKLVGSDDVVFGFLDNGRDRFNNYEDIGLYINAMPLVAHVDHHDMRAFLDRLSDVYYELSQNNYFPFGPLAQEFNIAPIILFQFFPDWITEDGKYDHLPQNETLINKIFSMQKDFIVEALTEIIELENCYTLRITYSGYYSRKMMKKLARTYQETIVEMLKA